MNSILEKKEGRINSPDELEEYIQVTTPPVWMLVLAMAIFVIGLFVYSIFGTVTGHTPTGEEEQIHPIHFIIN